MPSNGSKYSNVGEAVQAELDFDPMIDPSAITVTNRNGFIKLEGFVPNYPQYLEAADAARRVGGVTGVQNSLEVGLPTKHYRSDQDLTNACNAALAMDLLVPDTIQAMAEAGKVTLTGTVNYAAQRDAAEDDVASLIGVRSIVDYITISNGDVQIGDVVMAVQDALDRNALIVDDSDVLVTSGEHTVTLTGNVRTWAEHDAVLDAAWMAPGVYDVRDDVYVTG
jgi:osmotically-inducible protein OsmY